MRIRVCLTGAMLALGMMSLTVAAPRLMAQAQVTGGLAGLITDPSGAAVPGATVTATNNNDGSVEKATTDAQGGYRFALLRPAAYTITVAHTGFQTAKTAVTVQLGQVASLNLKIAVAASSQTVEVKSTAVQLLQTENGNTADTISETVVKSVPVPGGDLNYLAQLAPGAVNTGGGFPSMYGMPTSSNLYTLDGMEDVDPWNNGTNGGASNLLLGMNEVQEATVVSNGYSGQYGTLAGSNVNIVTKSGGNNFHGNAIWNWNGDKLNANNWFNNANGTLRPVSIANQWAGSFGGPILKNKLFFFVDNEGLTVVLPASQQTLIPTQAFETATLANLAATGHTNSLPFYNTIFKLYNGAAGAAQATPVANSCGTLAVPGGVCAQQFYSNATNFAWEDVTTARVDWNISNTDHAYVHYSTDHGVQSTGIDPINPAFNAVSNQPQFQAQAFWSHTMGSNAVNTFSAAAQNYKATFTATNLATALATFPTTLQFNDGSFTTLGGSDNIWPEGRNVTRVQLSDDYSLNAGAHAFQAGEVYSRYLVNDKVFGEYTSGLLAANTLDAFYNGGVDPNSPATDTTSFQQRFPLALEQPMRMYRLGVYAQDQWRMRPDLSVTLSLRLDHPSNPVCATNCFAQTDPFQTMSHDPGQPYNAAIHNNLANALPGLQTIEWQPRVGFAWQPFGASSSTVVRGGLGMFSDNFPVSIVSGFATNLPQDPQFTPSGDNLAPGEASNLYKDAANDEAALKAGFANGATLAQLQAAVPGFKPPSLTSADGNLKDPTYYKWNLEVQRQLNQNAAVNLSYNGNRGIHELMQNGSLNAYAANYNGLPAAPTDPRFGQVTVYQSNGVSNYNGLTGVFKYNNAAGALQLSYTWSHTMDEGFGTGQTRTIEYPNNLLALYGPADQDVRHVADANYVWNVPLQRWVGGPTALTGNWKLSGTLMARTGLPYSVLDNSESGKLNNTNLANRNVVLANFLGGAVPTCSTPDAACQVSTQFSKATTGFGAQGRNLFRAPGFWDSDLTLAKDFTVPFWERASLDMAASAYNVFNHPNFGKPGTNLDSRSTFGRITSMAGNASSILGNNGGDSSPRLVQLRIGLTF